MDSMEILSWLKVGYEKADDGNAPVLIMGTAKDQDSRGFLRTGETIVDMANHGPIFAHSFEGRRVCVLGLFRI